MQQLSCRSLQRQLQGALHPDTARGEGLKKTWVWVWAAVAGGFTFLLRGFWASSGASLWLAESSAGDAGVSVKGFGKIGGQAELDTRTLDGPY